LASHRRTPVPTCLIQAQTAVAPQFRLELSVKGFPLVARYVVFQRCRHRLARYQWSGLHGSDDQKASSGLAEEFIRLAH
jgi:hypothetical protein